MRFIQHWIRKCLSVTFTKKYSTNVSHRKIEIDKLRNIGILAHIDAGKTTTTERMLYYSGTISNMGEVHHGNTVTDWMDQERRRGITITAAAVSFEWSGHLFNLIDTPGHIDFTMEVEQTLNVLDGTVVVLDGSAGVEAQTLTVWRQADRYKIPRIIFINKMDRQDSNLEICLESIKSKLDITPICLQIPIKTNDKLTGIIDILTLEKIIWDPNNRGKNFKRIPLKKDTDGKLYDDIYLKRMNIVDSLTDYDDALADTVIQSGSLEKVSPVTILQSIRNATFNQKAIPVVMGSAYKNIGVQPLMDAVINYLPSPNERNKQFKCFGNNLCARAFKIIHHEQRGPLVFFRLYSGQFTKGQKIYNIQQELTEQTGKLLMAYADEFKEVNQIDNGNIAVVTGIKQTVTGDLITSSATVANNAKRALEKYLKKSDKDKTREVNLVDDLFGVGRRVPEPVFFCSIEPPSLSYVGALEQALTRLCREDPSLRVSYNQETGQTVLAGMGELHIEIIKERIKTEYKIDVDIGPLQIAYKEAPQKHVKDTHIVEHRIGKSKHFVSVTLSVIPVDNKEQSSDSLILDKSQESASNLANIFPKHLLAVKNGVDAALSHGPKLGCPVVGVNVILHWLEVGRGTSDTIISSAVTQCLQKLLLQSEIVLLEPIMNLEIVCSEEYVSTVIADLSRRRASVQQVTTRGKNRVVQSFTPLAELLGYAKDLRTITSGTATFSMQFNSYQPMNSVNETRAIQSVTGL